MGLRGPGQRVVERAKGVADNVEQVVRALHKAGGEHGLAGGASLRAPEQAGTARHTAKTFRRMVDRHPRRVLLYRDIGHPAPLVVNAHQPQRQRRVGGLPPRAGVGARKSDLLRRGSRHAQAQPLGRARFCPLTVSTSPDAAGVVGQAMDCITLGPLTTKKSGLAAPPTGVPVSVTLPPLVRSTTGPRVVPAPSRALTTSGNDHACERGHAGAHEPSAACGSSLNTKTCHVDTPTAVVMSLHDELARDCCNGSAWPELSWPRAHADRLDGAARVDTTASAVRAPAAATALDQVGSASSAEDSSLAL